MPPTPSKHRLRARIGSGGDGPADAAIPAGTTTMRRPTRTTGRAPFADGATLPSTPWDAVLARSATARCCAESSVPRRATAPDPLGRLIQSEEIDPMPAHPVIVTRRRPRRAPGDEMTYEPLLPVLMTERGGQVSHYVTDDQVTAPLRGNDPRALCGTAFIPAALTTPPGPVCSACLDRLRPPARAGRSSRWGRHRHPAGPNSAITTVARA